MYVIKIQNGDLTHHGILGMRWGIRRYQPYSVRGRGSGKKGKEIGDAAKAGKRLSRKEKKILAEREAAKKKMVEKRNQETFEAQRFKEEKDRLLREGKASEILANKKYFTDQELSQVVNRLRSVESLESMSKKEVSEVFDRIDKIMGGAKKVSDWGDTGIKLYNQMAGLYNATQEGKKKPMSYVKTGSGEGKKKK